MCGKGKEICIFHLHNPWGLRDFSISLSLHLCLWHFSTSTTHTEQYAQLLQKLQWQHTAIRRYVVEVFSAYSFHSSCVCECLWTRAEVLPRSDVPAGMPLFIVRPDCVHVVCVWWQRPLLLAWLFKHSRQKSRKFLRNCQVFFVASPVCLSLLLFLLSLDRHAVTRNGSWNRNYYAVKAEENLLQGLSFPILEGKEDFCGICVAPNLMSDQLWGVVELLFPYLNIYCFLLDGKDETPS